MIKSDRLRIAARRAMQLFVLLAVAFLSAVTAMRLAIQGREVEVPRVIGMHAGDAQGALSGQQLGMRIADRMYSEQPKDSVVRQSPPAGTRVKAGQKIQVVLSLGTQRVSIPPLEGKNLRTARIELLRSGLQTGEISSVYVPDVEPGVILQQNPPAAAKNAGSPRVNLLVSMGEPETALIMPDITGLPLAEALRRIASIGLRLTKTSYIPSAYAAKGTVTQQVPLRGARVVAGMGVELQIVE
jgi:serine/threonine-protein kinase